MGIADRDYARPDQNTRGRASGVARVRAMSVTGWLIAINVAVFVLANILLKNTNADVSAGMLSLKDVSTEEIRQAVVKPEAGMYPVPGQPFPAYFQYPAFDRATNKHIGGLRMQHGPVLHEYGHFSTGKVLELQVWRFLTFQFLHADPTHLLFNMLGLFFVGTLVEQYLGARRYIAYYLLCGICGALGYLALNLLGYVVLQQWPQLKYQVPALLFDDVYTPLIGASAGVFGVLMAAAFIAPRAIVMVFFVIPMKLRTAVYLFLGLAMLNLVRGGSNAGGDAAHVGGAIAGAYFIRHTHLLREFFDIFGNSRLFPQRRAAPPKSGPVETEIDRILSKVRSEGLQSLTDRERLVLRRASEGA